MSKRKITVPLDMKSMVRYCHPPTPHVGLHRQSGDHARTLQYYREAKKKRDISYFPSMLRIMTSRFHPYRLLRRLWLKVLGLKIGCYYLISTIMDLLSADRIEPIPNYFTKYHEFHLRYELLNTPIRFKQMVGRLVELGFPDRNIPEIDYEYESYLSKFHAYFHPRMTDLYQQLCQKKIQQKWHIMLSYLPFHLQRDISNWEHHVLFNRLSLTLQAFHRQHHLSTQEHVLMTSWIELMKYPSY